MKPFLFQNRLHLNFVMVLVLLCLLASCQKGTQLPESPVAPPMPSFLPWVYPAPDAKLNALAYHKGITRFDTTTKNAVCIELNGYELIEMGDSGLELEDYLARSYFTINGKTERVTYPQSIIDFLGLGGGIDRIDPQTGETSIVQESSAMGPWIMCWEIELKPGMHTVEFKTRKTSGAELSYSWSFTITE